MNILRQDPDIIMVGEIRDSETANISIRAAITGHLVLSTLHTKDASSTAIRLSDMEVSDYLIADSLVAVIAQRLVRKICPYCKEEYIPSNKERKLLNLHDNMKVYKGKGCKFCNGSGYKGRRAIFEIMYLDDIHRELLREKETSKKIKEYSVEKGMMDIRSKHRELVLKGITTIEEMMRNSYGYI
ncbi:GspE/PulE family protein [Clostridium botulinum]|uniref:GspE/PulE family protein n=1 Tax=Clostridium botulinum TaxID=1491 RepID=UPI0027E1CBE9|nr:ATPase, T2SS/T4P/T4SS family [Clostridium botulinum]